jgi:hypothetical protein
LAAFKKPPSKAAAECWGALTGSGQSFFDNRKAGNPRRQFRPDYGRAKCHGVDITSLLESSKTVESNKQRQLKQLPDEMRNRKPMSGAAETYPVSDHPKHKVNGAVDSQDVFKELSRSQAQRKEDGLGEFYD